MYRIIRIILVAAWLTAFQGCIENDIPYPVVELEIVSSRARVSPPRSTVRTAAWS